MLWSGLTHIPQPARNIVYIAFDAILCGMRTWEDIEDFGHGKKKLSIRHKMNKAILNQENLGHLLSMLWPSHTQHLFWATCNRLKISKC